MLQYFFKKESSRSARGFVLPVHGNKKGGAFCSLCSHLQEVWSKYYSVSRTIQGIVAFLMPFFPNFINIKTSNFAFTSGVLLRGVAMQFV